MRKVILYFHMSLDNVVSDPDQWMLMNDDILKAATDYYEQLGTILFGSQTYPFLSDYWQQAEQNSDSATEREFARKINQIQKFVLSRSSVELTWKNSELLDFKDIASLSAQIRTLKEQPGKDISVESGIGIWKLFLKNSLFDELRIVVHPVIAGKGERVFSDMQQIYTLELKRTRTFDNGVVEMHYQKK